jgi:hypothetical protein
MKAGIVETLERRIEAATTDEERAALITQLACYWARTGEFESAEQLRRDVRTVFGDGRAARVSILLMALDGLILYFRSLGSEARDRMMRAHLISVGCRMHDLVALTSAWLAHFDFNLGRYDSMASELITCRNSLVSDDGSAEVRMALVLGDSLLYCGEDRESLRWYEVARRIANRTGDRATIGAITYNRAALHIAAARVASLKQPIDDKKAMQLELELNSAFNYQAGAGLQSLEHLLHSSRASLFMMKGDYASALMRIADTLERFHIPDTTAQFELMREDQACCLALLGKVEEASRALEANAVDRASRFSEDDAVVFWGTRARTLAALGKTSEATLAQAKAEAALSDHIGVVSGLRSLLGPFLDSATTNRAEQ